MVFVLGMAISIANILASKGKVDWDLDDRLWAMRWYARGFFLFSIWQASHLMPFLAHTGGNFTRFEIWSYDIQFSAAMALVFSLVFAVEADCLRHQIKKRERELKNQMAVPSAAKPAQ